MSYSHLQKVASILSLLLCIGLLIGGCDSSGENQEWTGTVQGEVIDAQNGERLPGVNILEVGTNNGTVTDENGEFEIDVSNQEAELRVSFVGYETKTVPVNGRPELTIELERSS